MTKEAKEVKEVKDKEAMVEKVAATLGERGGDGQCTIESAQYGA
jgi:hypothetical protein